MKHEKRIAESNYFTSAPGTVASNVSMTPFADSSFSNLRRVTIANANGIKLMHPKYMRHRAAVTVIAPFGGKRQMCCPTSAPSTSAVYQQMTPIKVSRYARGLNGGTLQKLANWTMAQGRFNTQKTTQ